MALVLGIDPGFASVGYALVEVRGSETTVVQLGLIRTNKWKPPKLKKGEKAAKVAKPSVSEDNLARAQEIATTLGPIVKQADIVCVEAMSYPRNASAAAKMALCWGVIATLTKVYRHLVVLQISPQKLKENLTGKKDAEKLEIQATLDRRFTRATLAEKGIQNIPKSLWEHPYDALGAVVSCLDRPEIATLRLSEK